MDTGLNRFKKFVCFIFILEAVLIFSLNAVFLYEKNDRGERLYRVEAQRVVQELKESDTLKDLTDVRIMEIDLSEYETIVRVSEFDADETVNNDYIVEEINGKLYRIEYKNIESYGILIYINVMFAAMLIITVIVLYYVYKKILKPFHDMERLTFELAKGNLSVPIKEEKSKFFGKFLWGMDMLREELESKRQKELEFEKDKNTLILSLSHDIKTPLSSIELYSRALSENLYDTQEKRDAAISGITKNVNDIKKYVDEIASASREDFLNLEVVNDEFYLSELIKETEKYYRDKLSVVHTELIIDDFSECLIKGDKNRLIEVMQNIIENAIKYGDGRYIRIYCTDEEDCRLIHIENSGCTLEEKELANIFDSFYRGTNSRNIKGNGLGLYICKNLMHKMDGEIFAQIEKEKFLITVVIKKA